MGSLASWCCGASPCCGDRHREASDQRDTSYVVLPAGEPSPEQQQPARPRPAPQPPPGSAGKRRALGTLPGGPGLPARGAGPPAGAPRAAEPPGAPPPGAAADDGALRDRFVSIGEIQARMASDQDYPQGPPTGSDIGIIGRPGGPMQLSAGAGAGPAAGPPARQASLGRGTADRRLGGSRVSLSEGENFEDARSELEATSCSSDEEARAVGSSSSRGSRAAVAGAGRRAEAAREPPLRRARSGGRSWAGPPAPSDSEAVGSDREGAPAPPAPAARPREASESASEPAAAPASPAPGWPRPALPAASPATPGPPPAPTSPPPAPARRGRRGLGRGHHPPTAWWREQFAPGLEPRPEEAAAIARLREELARAGLLEALAQPPARDELQDLNLLRFLRARQGDVPKARDMLLAHLRWRAEWGVDALMAPGGFDYPELPQVLQCYPQGYHKTDREGRPVWLEKLGHLNVTGLLRVTTSDRFLRYHIYQYERNVRQRMPAAARAAGRPVAQSLAIMDLEGIKLREQLNRDVWRMIRAIAALDQANYPERLARMLFVNAPWTFQRVWATARSFLDPATAAKIEVLGGPAKHRPRLLELVAPENLPDWLGGTCRCPGPGGCLASDAGPWQEAAYTSESADLIQGAVLPQEMQGPGGPAPGGGSDGRAGGSGGGPTGGGHGAGAGRSAGAAVVARHAHEDWEGAHAQEYAYEQQRPHGGHLQGSGGRYYYETHELEGPDADTEAEAEAYYSSGRGSRGGSPRFSRSPTARRRLFDGGAAAPSGGSVGGGGGGGPAGGGTGYHAAIMIDGAGSSASAAAGSRWMAMERDIDRGQDQDPRMHPAFDAYGTRSRSTVASRAAGAAADQDQDHHDIDSLSDPRGRRDTGRYRAAVTALEHEAAEMRARLAALEAEVSSLQQALAVREASGGPEAAGRAGSSREAAAMAAPAAPHRGGPATAQLQGAQPGIIDAHAISRDTEPAAPDAGAQPPATLAAAPASALEAGKAGGSEGRDAARAPAAAALPEGAAAAAAADRGAGGGRASVSANAARARGNDDGNDNEEAEFQDAAPGFARYT